MGKSRNRILGLTAAAMAVGVVACEDTTTEVSTQPDGATLASDVTSAAAALDGVSAVEVEFRATWNHDLGEFEIETLSQRVDTPLLAMEDGAILREAEQGLYCPIRVTQGRPFTVSLETTSLGFTPIQCGFTGFPYDTQGAFCAEIAVTNHYPVELSNVYAELTSINPDTGHNGYAYPNGTGANPAAVTPGNGAPTNVLGLWGYGTIAGGATGSTQWTLEYTPEPFSFQGRIAATVAESCNNDDDDCDGLIDEGAGCYQFGDACTDNSDCASFNCDTGLCGNPLPEDCATAGDEDGNGVADCEDIVCAGQTDPLGGTCPSCGVQISALGEYTGTTVGGTSQNAVRSSNDVTYFFTPPATGDYSIDTCGSDYDTYLYVFDGTCGSNGTTVAFDDDADGTFCDVDNNQSHIETVSLTAGTEYMIVVEGFGAADEGAVGLNIAYNGAESDFGAGACSDGIDNNNNGVTDCDEGGCSLIDGCPAARGLCANPYAVGAYGTYNGTTSGATDDNAPSGTCFGGVQAADHAYLFVAPATGQVTIDMTGSTIDTVVYVQSTCGDGLTEIACNDDQAFTNQDAQVTFGAVEGESYFIIVDGNGEAGDYAMTITGPDPPAYDCTAPGQTVGYGTYNGLITLSDTDSYQTCGAGLGGDRVYEFTSPASGTVTVTVDADFPVSISSRDTLCSDAGLESGCAQGDGTAPVVSTFTATQNTTYYVFVDAVDTADVGQFTIDFAGPAAPAQTCADPNLIPTFGTVYTNTAVGGLANVETSTCGSSSSPEAVFAWTAPAGFNGTVEATTAGSAYDTVLSVWDTTCGDTPASELACNDDEAFPDVTTSRIAWTAAEGTTYYLLVQGFSVNSGNVVLTLEGPENLYAGASCADGTDNDGDGFLDCSDNDCSNVDGCAPVTADSCVDTTPLNVGNAGTFATSGNDFPDGSGDDYAFYFTVPADGDYVFETCGADFDTSLAFYAGNCTGDLNVLNGLVYNPDNCPSDLGESFTLGGLTAGDEWLIVVEGNNGETGTFPFNVIYTGSEADLAGAGACSDSIDNNNDGTTDCADFACGGIDGCPATPGTCGAPFVANLGANAGDTSVLGLSQLTPEGSVGTCSSAGAGTWTEDVWQFVAPVDGTMEFTTDVAGGTHTDTTLYIRSTADCDTGLVDLACDDDGGTTVGLNSTISGFAVTAGTPYAIIVDGWGTNEGTYTLDLSIVADVGQPDSGCTDSRAANYDATALYDDGSCTFPAENYLLFTFDQTGSFASEVSWQLIDDSDSSVVIDNTDESDVTQYVPDGCYLVVGVDSFGDGWNGPWLLDVIEDGGAGAVVIDDFTVLSTDPATATDTTSNTASTYLSIGGGCIEGCTDPAADNYDVAAQFDDGTCTYPAGVQLLNDGADYLANDAGLTLYIVDGDTNAPSSNCDATCQFTWPIFLASTPGVGVGLSAGDFGTFSNAGSDQSTWYNWPLYTYAGDTASGDLNGDGLVNGAGTWFAARPSLFGCTDTNATNFSAGASFDDGSCVFPPANTISITWILATGWTNEYAYDFVSVDTTVLFSGDSADVTTFVPDGCYRVEGSDTGADGWNYFDGSQGSFDVTDGTGATLVDDYGITFTSGATHTPSAYFSVNGGCIYGCIDPVADNYNAGANVDDGSCTYAASGCTDPVAQNYDSLAVADDGSCLYDDENLISITWTLANGWTSEISWDFERIDGTVMFSGGDADVVDQAVADGCYRIVGADQYDDGWDYFDGSESSMDVTNAAGTLLLDDYGAGYIDGVIPPSAYFSVDGATDAAGGCIFGCIDPAASNYNAGANVDDGSCTYSTPGCTDTVAQNYNAAANIDDGSCLYDDENLISITWTLANGWTSEISWDFERIDGTVMFSGGDADVVDQVVADGCYRIVGADQYDDGWDYFDGSESSMDVTNAAGTLLLDDYGAGYIDGVIPPSAFFSVDGATDAAGGCIFGCMDPAADNYDASANVEDGSCTYTLPNSNLISITWTLANGWTNEISYEIQDELGTVVFTGDDQNEVDIIIATDGCYRIVGADQYDDGWDYFDGSESSMDVTNADGTLLVDDYGAGYIDGVIPPSAYFQVGPTAPVCP